MAMPPKSQIDEVLKQLESTDGTLALNPGASALDQFRWQIHQQFVLYIRTHKITQRELSEMLRIDEAKVSKILHHRLDGFSTDRLITLCEKLNPNLILKVG